MARFYKTDGAMPLDYMYRINAPLMEKVLGVNDAMIDSNLDQLNKLSGAVADFPYLSPDEGRVKQINDDYTNQINTLSDTIRKDPANWRKQLDPIRTLGQNIVKNYKTGEVSKIVGNYNQYKSTSDYIDKEVENYNKDGKGGLDAASARAYKQYYLNEFVKKNPNGTAYDSKTGTYNAINTFNPVGNMDVRKVLGNELDKIKADSNSYKVDKVTGQEWYFNTQKQKWEGVTPDKILGIVSDRLQDPQLMNYLKERQQVGLINGAFDDSGKFINPYSVNSVDPMPEEQDKIKLLEDTITKIKDTNIKGQLQSALDSYKDSVGGKKSIQWNSQSYLSPILRGLTNQYSYGKTETENLLRNNSAGSTKFVQDQTNQRQRLTLSQQDALAKMREAGINDRFGKKMEWDKYKWNNPHTKDNKTVTGTKKTDTETPTESTVSKLATNSFEDWLTVDNTTGQKVKVLSNAGLSSDISSLRTKETEAKAIISKLTNAMGDYAPESQAYNSLKIQKEAIEKTLPQIQSDLSARRKWYNSSVEAALTNNPSSLKNSNGELATNLTPDEVAIYRKGKDKILSENYNEVQNIKKEFTSSNLAGNNKYANDRRAELKEKAYQLGYDPYGNELPDNIVKKRFFEIKKKVDDRRDNFLAQVRYTPIDTDAIQVGTKESKDLNNILFSNPQGLKMYDATGNKADNIQLEGKGISWFDPKGDNYSMTTANDKNNLINYMTKYGVTPKIEQVGNTTKIGTGGAVVKITFNDPNKEIPSTPFYIELTPDMQKQFGTRLGLSKDAGVKKIADDILDNEGNNIRRQLITPTVSRTAGASNTYDPVTTTIFINHGNQKIPFQVTKFIDEDGSDHLNVTGTVDGKQIALPNTASGIPGWFNGAEDFIKYVQSNKQNK